MSTMIIYKANNEYSVEKDTNGKLLLVYCGEESDNIPTVLCQYTNLDIDEEEFDGEEEYSYEYYVKDLFEDLCEYIHKVNPQKPRENSRNNMERAIANYNKKKKEWEDYQTEFFKTMEKYR